MTLWGSRVCFVWVP